MPELQANGKKKIPVTIAPGESTPVAPVATSVKVCLLSRDGHNNVVLERATPAEVRRAVEEDLKAVQGLYDATKDMPVTMLCADGGWRLRLSHDPAEAIGLLTDAVAGRGR